MCGIVGYIGPNRASDFLIDGLHKLEYRGYDSSGIGTLKEGNLSVVKTAGRVDSLVALLKDRPVQGTIGIGHTRWATHGPATDANAHPHLGDGQLLALVHNGVIENYQALKGQLIELGYEFQTQTDSEVVAQLITHELRRCDNAFDSTIGDQSSGNCQLNGDPSDQDQLDVGPVVMDPYSPLVEAVQNALAQLRGTYGLAIIFRDWPDAIVVARLGSPLVIGIGNGEHFIASDSSPLAGRAQQIVYLADHEIAVVTKDAIRVIHRDQGDIGHDIQQLNIVASDIDLGGFPHFMLKEIYEQPETIRAAMRGRLDHDAATAVFGGLNLSTQQLRGIDRFVLTACGTSWHASLVGEYMIEALARIPVEVEYASELRYRNPPLSPRTLLFALTQSGETIDTLAALREMKRKGHPTMAICNVVGSTIARESDGGIYLHAGPEIGVASTKAYTSQCVVLSLLALYFGRLHHLSFEEGHRIIKELVELPDKVENALTTDADARRIAARFAECDNFLYLGRLYNFPTALEGALKLKEISYIHAEGYPAAEMKHGPIALVDEQTPSLFLVPQDAVYEKVLANLEEIKARGGPVIAIVTEGDCRVEQLADEVIYIPRTADYLQPIVAAIPLQLLAYHIAVLRNCDIDKPRNLAKSVTVE
jgi:glutamine---fructose-6-phosphate transaminase (isomerizing)